VKIVYGIHPVEELIKNRQEDIECIYIDKNCANTELFEILKTCRSNRLSYNVVPRNKIDEISLTKKNQGIVATCSAKSYLTEDDFFEKLQNLNHPALILLPSSVEDPGNLGAIIRSAVAFGADVLLMEKKNTAPLNSTVVKTSAGMTEYMEFCKPRNLEKVISDLQSLGYQIIGAEKGHSTTAKDVDFNKPTILVLGGEHKGIPPYLRKQCQKFVEIHIDEKVDSLNVSVAASILLYEAYQQKLK